MDIKERVDKIIADGYLTDAEHQEFKNAVNEDGEISPEESNQIDRLIELIKSGELTVRG